MLESVFTGSLRDPHRNGGQRSAAADFILSLTGQPANRKANRVPVSRL